MEPALHGRDRRRVPSAPIVNVGIALAVFPVVFLGELPDKTMFTSLVLSTRGRPRAVWCGAAGAFAVHVAIAVSVGAVLVHLVPRRGLDAGVAATFFAGAIWALWSWQRQNDPVGSSPVAEPERPGPGPGSWRRSVWTAFLAIFVAEWGDLTQVLTADLAARTHAPISVAVGALAALWIVAGLAVMGGRGLLRVTNPRTVRALTAVVLLVLAAVTAVQAAS